MTDLRAPFPYFGGKSRIAPLIWERFGNVPNYVEPFFGSGAVLLARPHAPKTETVNDANAFLSNFWRALQADPDAVAHYADWPVNECDLHARHLWLVTEGAGHVERCKTDPDYYDAKIAGWWVWGACQWIGAGWCSGRSSWGKPFADGKLVHDRAPHLMPGRGVHRPHLKRPNIGHDGYGVHRLSHQVPALDPGGRGAFRQTEDCGIQGYMRGLAKRLCRVRVCCGDWSRITGPTPTVKHGLTGVFLDPPYDEAERSAVYSTETPGVATDVRAWCLENGADPLLRIALCGYAGEGHEVLESQGWQCVSWKTAGGYGNQGGGEGNKNARRERIWFSPHCLKLGLFDHNPEPIEDLLAEIVDDAVSALGFAPTSTADRKEAYDAATV